MTLLLILLALAVGFVLTVILYVAWYQWRYTPKLEPRGELRTHVPVSGDTLRLYALADTGTGSPTQYAVADAMERRCHERPADALLLMGDLFYLRGVSGLDDEQWQTKIEEPYSRGALAGLPIYPLFGNHDVLGNLQAQLDYSRVNPRWKMPYRFYTVTFGNLLKLVAFDSNFTDIWFDGQRGALDYLMAELKGPRRSEAAGWTAVMAHHPIASASPRGGRYSGGYYGWFLQRFICGRTHLHLNGHSHHLEHRPMPHCGLHSFISGGGSESLHATTDDPRPAYAHSGNGFLELTITRDQIDARFVLVDGSTGYETVLRPEDF